MKRLTLGFAALSLFVGSYAAAQEPAVPPRAPLHVPATVKGLSNAPSPSAISPTETPELWLYLYEQRRYDDPKQAVRRNAELRAAQRRSRMEARKWLGYSPQRPATVASPFTSGFAPTWINPQWAPDYWLSYGQPLNVFSLPKYR